MLHQLYFCALVLDQYHNVKTSSYSYTVMCYTWSCAPNHTLSCISYTTRLSLLLRCTVSYNCSTIKIGPYFAGRLEPIMLLKNCLLCFEQCSKIHPIMLKIMLKKSRLCSRVGCFIRVYQSFLTVVLE